MTQISDTIRKITKIPKGYDKWRERASEWNHIIIFNVFYEVKTLQQRKWWNSHWPDQVML